MHYETVKNYREVSSNIDSRNNELDNKIWNLNFKVLVYSWYLQYS